MVLLACGGGAEDPNAGFPETTMHEAVETGIHYDFTYRGQDERAQPGREGMWVTKLNVYPNAIEGSTLLGAINRTVAINDGDTWDLGEEVDALVMDISIRTVDGFDPMDRIVYTLVAISDSTGAYGPGDTNNIIQEAERDGAGNVTVVKRWKLQTSEDEAAPVLPRWQGGQTTTLRLCPEAERIAQGESVIGWCAFACETPSLDEDYQLGQYSVCVPQ
jgi:hypothetical protein